ncbi:MAG: serine/threonine-protein kinase [Deltaproteobacteria bacterium]|nr:serine/threonine-protein kinase [Deltaproteobacteria bacterium]
MTDTQATKSIASPTPTPVTPRGLDRDLAFAEAERRLLGRELQPVKLDRFVVLHRVGQGAMGVVYAAHDPKLDRKVALKLVDTGGYGSEGVADAQSRIEREARAAADLAHPNVVTIYDTGTVGDQVFLAMEFIDGQTLRHWLRPDRTWREVVALFIEIGRGLAAAHDKGVVHRDFKPDNVLVGKDGRPRVVDFGLARPIPAPMLSSQSLVRTARDDDRGGGSGYESDDDAPTQSRDTSIAGTPAYMAPEQYQGRNIGPASDQFGFCVALYEALLGGRPFKGANPTALAEAVLGGQRQPLPRGHAVPPPVLAVVLQGLLPHRNDRHRSMHHLIAGLQRATGVRRRRWLAVAGATLLAGSITATYALASTAVAPAPDPCMAARQPLQAVWNDERRDEIAGAFEGLSAQAGEAWERIEPKFDRFAEHWGDMRQQACEDAQHRGEQSVVLLELRYACLDRALARLDVYATQFESPTVFKAGVGAAAADDLDRLWRCEDRERLLAGLRSNGLAQDNDVNRRADGITLWNEGYDKLSTAEAEHKLGRRGSALEMVREVVADAQRAKLRTLEAEARLLLGRWTRDRAEQERALDLSLAGGAPDQAAEIGIAIASLISEPGGGDTSIGRQHLRYAQGLLDRAASRYSGSLEVRIEAVRGLLAQRDGDNVAARKHLEDALGLARARLPPDHASTLTIMGNLARAINASGDTAAAAALFGELLQRQREILGPRHTDVGATAFNLGATALRERRFDEAERLFRQADEIWGSVYGANHAQRSLPLEALGEIHRRRGEPAAARPLQQQALLIREKAIGKDHPALCSVLDELGTIAFDLGDGALAREYLERALVIRRAAEDSNTAQTLTKLGHVLVQDGEPERGRALLEEALTLRSREGVDPLARAETEMFLARALVATHDDGAQAMADAGLARLRAAGERRREERAEAERWYAAAFNDPKG